MQSQSSGRIRASLVFRIAHNRTVRIGQVYANLIAATGLKFQFHQRGRRSSSDHPVMSHRKTCSLTRSGAVDLERAAFIQA